MSLSLHQNTSLAAGYRKSLEGWSKAGIKNVEITDRMLDDFLKTDTLAAARSRGEGSWPDGGFVRGGATGLVDSGRHASDFARNLEETLRAIRVAWRGADLLPAVTTRKVTAEDYKGAPDCIRQAGDVAKQYRLTAMIEFTRNSTFIATLTTALKLIREAAHPNVRPMLDCYHFWSGLSKFEDLDLLRPGELAHVHFQDVPDMPRELLDNTTRIIPGDGVSPLVQILRKLAEKGYAGALSVELFLPEFQQGDPYEVADENSREGRGRDA